MDQETVAKVVLKELIEFGFCKEEDSGVIYNYLMQVYSTGYDLGRYQFINRKIHHLARPVIQMTVDGIFIQIWDSAAAAGRGLKMKGTSITKCIHGHYKTCGGFKWKHAPPISSLEPTVGSTKAKSDQPEQENHVSKIASEQSPPELP